MNRNCRHQLVRDINNKNRAIGIDKFCHSVDNKSRAIDMVVGVEMIDKNVTDPQSWANMGQRNLRESQGSTVYYSIVLDSIIVDLRFR